MFNTNNILPKRFFIAKTENTIEIKNEKIASFGGKYATSKMLDIEKNKRKLLININIIEKINAIVI
jgi:c-di-GMP-binding flagellar brake protein YcgR